MKITRQGQYCKGEIETWVSCRYQDHRADQGSRYRDPTKTSKESRKSRARKRIMHLPADRWNEGPVRRERLRREMDEGEEKSRSKTNWRMEDEPLDGWERVGTRRCNGIV